jgi:hypothetical protein
MTVVVFVAFTVAATWLGASTGPPSFPGPSDQILVRSGDRVTVSVTVGKVRAFGSGIASGSGKLGDTIRVLPTEGRRALTARITGPATVEINP